jgi:hypothetical protein
MYKSSESVLSHFGGGGFGMRKVHAPPKTIAFISKLLLSAFIRWRS